MNYCMGIMLVGVCVMLVSSIGAHLPARLFDRDDFRFEEFDFERGGQFYEDVFAVSAWKSSLPDLGSMVNCVFEKKMNLCPSPEYIKKFIVETRRSEFIHWVISFAGLPYWMRVDTGLIGFAVFMTYLIVNMPFIIVQRYNRPRLKRLLGLVERRTLRLSSPHIPVGKEAEERLNG